MRFKKYIFPALALSLSLTLSGCQLFNRDNSSVHIGMEAIGQKRYEEALEAFNKAEIEKEDRVLIARGMGLAYLGMENYGESIRYLEDALSKVKYGDKKLEKDILLYLASVYELIEDFDKSIERSTKALSIEKDVQGLYLRGRSYFLSNRTEEAEGDFKEALNMEKGNFELYQNIYQLYKDHGKSADGTRILQSILNTDNKLSALNRGIIYYAMENIDDTLTYLESAAENGNNTAQYYLGQVYLKKEMGQEAKEKFDIWLERHPNKLEADGVSQGMVYNGLARASLLLQDYENALVYIDKGLEVEDSNHQYLNKLEVVKSLRYNKIVILEKQGRYSEAYQEAIQFVNDYPQDELGIKERDFLSTR